MANLYNFPKTPSEAASGKHPTNGPRLKSDGGGGIYDDMEQRVIRIEEWAKLSDQRMGRLETKLDALPTKGDMLAMFLAVFAAMGLVLAGLGWLETRASRVPAPLTAAPPAIIFVPAQPTVADTPSTPANRGAQSSRP